ncbi:MAG: hypothetical protein JXB04_10335 [Kiritimatiellae bacterium]|nr:hypothetical protein [Kiritimatiellia bacterium]
MKSCLLKLVALSVAVLFLASCASPPPPRPAPRPAAVPEAPKPMVKITRGPRVMLLINEKSLGTIATSEVESMAAALLKKTGYKVVDQDMVRSNLKKDQQMLKMAGDARGAAAVGLQYGAEIIITGEAVAKPSARRLAESNFRSYEAAVTLNAIRTDNSETLATASEFASIVGLDDVSGGAKALKAAGTKSLEVLIPAMTEEWQVSGSKGASIALMVGGVDQTWKLKAVRDALRAVPGVENFIQRDYTAGVVDFEVESSIPAPDLAERLLVRPPEGLKLQVLNVAQGKIELRAVAVE